MNVSGRALARRGTTQSSSLSLARPPRPSPKTKTKATTTTQALLGGPMGNNNKSGPTRPPKLVIPGEQGPRQGGPGPKLVLPGQGGPAGGGASPSPGAPSAGPPPVQPGGFTNFRPPPGFMDGGGDSSPSLSTQEMLDRLQQGRGHWHELASYLPKLQREGIDGGIVEEMSGVDRRTQNMWVNSSTVYVSLKNSGAMSKETLSFFDQPGGERLLHELRFLSVEQRVASATYIVEQRMDDRQSEMLAKAVKEQKIRNGENEGFSEHPADCMAFKYYRDALENKRQEEVEVYITKGLELAVTAKAREALERLAADVEVEVAREAAGVVETKLDVVRLLREETGHRPVALAGNLASLDPEMVKQAPQARASGVFGTISFAGAGSVATEYDWVSIPSWSMTAAAKHLVAVGVTNCATLNAMRVTSSVNSEKDAFKISGEGLVLIDAADTDLSSAGSYYVAKGKDGAFDLLTPDAIADPESALGKVLLLCRPPAKQSSDSDYD